MWPANQGIRFLFPIIPFVIYYLTQGVLLVSKAIKFKYLNIAIFIFAYIIAFQGEKNVIRFSRLKTTDMEMLYNYIIQTTDKKSIIVFDNPRVLRLFTNRNSFYSTNKDTINKYANYIICRKDDLKYCNCNDSVFYTNSYTMYKVEKQDRNN